MHQAPSHTKKRQFSDLPTSMPTYSEGEYAIGKQVKHKLFGRGKILAVEGTGNTAKLTIQFSGNVRKKLIAKYAKLTHLQ